MAKYEITSDELRNEVVDYLTAKGVEVGDPAKIAITLPGGTKAPQRCASGSGLMTSGGLFRPGYDAKLKSALYAIIRGKPEQVPPELLEHGPMYRKVEDWTPELAQEALRTFSWPDPAPPKPKKEKVAKPEDEGDGTTNSDGQPVGASTKASRKRAAAAASGAPAE